MEASLDTEQLPLSIHVSSLSGIRYSLKKYIREFKYSPLVQVITNILFWICGGVILLVYLQIQEHSKLVASSLGVLFIPGSKSIFPVFLSASVYKLSVLPYFWGGMVMVWLLTLLVALVLSWGGRSGVISYLYAVCLVLLLLLAKVILSPLILFGG